MNSLFKTLTGIFNTSSPETSEADERYLADSTDIYDLERRRHVGDVEGDDRYRAHDALHSSVPTTSPNERTA